jgi:hypothetical protein
VNKQSFFNHRLHGFSQKKITTKTQKSTKDTKKGKSSFVFSKLSCFRGILFCVNLMNSRGII